MDYFNIAGVTLNLTGTIILAIRVTKILEALSFTAKMHDLNFKGEVLQANGQINERIICYGNATNIEQVEKSGVKLLVLGFILQIAGNICNVISLTN